MQGFDGLWSCLKPLEKVKRVNWVRLAPCREQAQAVAETSSGGRGSTTLTFDHHSSVSTQVMLRYDGWNRFVPSKGFCSFCLIFWSAALCLNEDPTDRSDRPLRSSSLIKAIQWKWIDSFVSPMSPSQAADTSSLARCSGAVVGGASKFVSKVSVNLFVSFFVKFCICLSKFVNRSHSGGALLACHSRRRHRAPRQAIWLVVVLSLWSSLHTSSHNIGLFTCFHLVFTVHFFHSFLHGTSAVGGFWKVFREYVSMAGREKGGELWSGCLGCLRYPTNDKMFGEMSWNICVSAGPPGHIFPFPWFIPPYSLLGRSHGVEGRLPKKSAQICRVQRMPRRI